MFEQIANIAEMMPLAEYLKIRIRILKLGTFCSQMLTWLRRDVGVKPPIDQVALALLFVIASYIPALLLTIVYAMTCKKKELPRFDPALFTFNKPDAAEMAKVLATVNKI